MDEKVRASNALTPTNQTLVGPWNFLADLQRWQMAIATESACAIFRNVEATRAVQQQTA